MSAKVKSTPISEFSSLTSIPEETLKRALREFRSQNSEPKHSSIERIVSEEGIIGSERGKFIKYLREAKLLRSPKDMLQGFCVGGFKAYDEEQKIDLAPITLIFGPNSCGKSSLLHSYLLGNDMFKFGNISVESPSLAKGQVNLGGPRSFVNGFKLKLRYSFKLLDGSDVEYSFIDTSEALSLVDSPLTRDNFDSNTSNKIFKYSQVIINKYPFHEESEIPANEKYYENEPLKYFRFLLSDVILIDVCLQSGNIMVNKCHPFIQKQFELNPISESQSLPISEEIGRYIKINGYEVIIHTSGKEELDLVLKPLSLLIKESLDVIRLQYRRAKYLGPFREPTHTDWIDEFSDKQAKHLETIADRFNLDITNKTLDQLQIPYQLEVDTIYSLKMNNMQEFSKEIETDWLDCRWENVDDYSSSSRDKESSAIDYAVRELMTMSQKTRRIFLVEKNKQSIFGSNRFKYSDVGFGISQVMPVVLNSLFLIDHTILIEQPELHIHPAIQTELGDLFIQSALGENHNRLILETHSEHLILRLLRRIRQTTENDSDYPIDLPKVKPEDVAVYYAEKTDKGTKLHRLRINPDGSFADEWPAGFFSERLNEIF